MPVPRRDIPAARTLLRDDAFTAIRQAIVDGTLQPGERLVDAELVEWLGVSRTPIREALTRLDAAGLVRTKPGRYTMVSHLDVRSTLDAQAVTASMHQLAMRVAVPLMDPGHLAVMTEANATFAAALDRGDAEAAIDADDRFHRVAADLAANAALIAVIDQYSPLLRRMERVRFSSMTGRSSVAQHERIIGLAELGRAEEAAEEVRLNWLTLQPTHDDV